MKCGKGARRSSIAFSKAQHKTDGSHPNRPFSYRKQAAGETTGFHPPPSPAMPFISVLREKESAPFRKDRKPVPLAPNLCYNEASEVNSMARMRLLNALPAGATQFEGFCIIKSVSVRQSIKGTDYLDLVLADAEGEAVAKLWDYNRAVQGEYQAGDVVKVRGSITIWKDAEQLKIERIRKSTPADNVDMSGLLPCAPFDPAWLYDELFELAGSFHDDDLRRLVQYLLRENRERLLYFPAAVKLHHATRGGLLHHSWTIVQLAKGVCATYPLLNTDLVYAGAILHDIGKLDEFETNELGLASAYSDAGQLLGHINIGVSVIASTAELLGVPRHTAMLLEHMLLSHHGAPEFGSPKMPMFPEAEVLSELDLLDSRMYEMFSALEGVQPRGFSERQWALDNRQLYNHAFGLVKAEDE